MPAGNTPRALGSRPRSTRLIGPQRKGELAGAMVHARRLAGRPSIAWASRTLSSRRPSFRFLHMDIHNRAYWPHGRLTVHQALGSFDQGDFDLVVAKSFFTHVLPEELDVYLAAIAPRLRPAGRALLTFFVLDDAGSGQRTDSSPRLHFNLMDGGYAVRSRVAPSAAVAYEESVLRNKLREHGLVQEGDIRRGWWRGIPDGLSFQDIIIVRKNA